MTSIYSVIEVFSNAPENWTETDPGFHPDVNFVVRYQSASLAKARLFYLNTIRNITHPMDDEGSEYIESVLLVESKLDNELIEGLQNESEISSYKVPGTPSRWGQ
jgi:hypothetical protein